MSQFDPGRAPIEPGRAAPGGLGAPRRGGEAAGVPLSLRDLFLVPGSGWEARLAQIAEGQQLGPDGGHGFGLDQIDRQVLARHVAERLHDALEVGIGQIMVRAWGRYRSLREHLDRSRQTPEEVLLVPLADHVVRSTHHPAIDLMANERRVASFKFSAEVAIQLQEVVLRVSNGNVTTVESGRWRAQGSLKFGQAALVDQDTPEFALPGPLDFSAGREPQPAVAAAAGLRPPPRRG